jgi:DNA mismatch repair protein MutL
VTLIQVLPPEEARKIAAGEVVDRPAALVREFMDNAIDAGGGLIEVAIEGGGARRTEVSDDGRGMGREDLEVCWQTHATSKIRSLEDLNTAQTLGFRGEALAAAAAVARLEIVSSQDGREAWKMGIGPGTEAEPELEQSRRARGTSVRALGLFDTLPARKRFLKREGSEGNLCRQIFTDKALAFPALGFRFVQDGSLKVFLPPVSSRNERFAAAVLGRGEGAFLHEIAASGPGFSVTIVAGGPELYRNDRRQQYVFANGRRIQEFSLLQALEYGVQGWFPNGVHPVGAVYVDIDPALADFNIHPAKREVRFADPGAIHHAITAALRDFSRHRNLYALNKGGEEKDASETFGDFSGEVRERPPEGYGGLSGGKAGGASRSSALALEALLAGNADFAPPPGRGKTEEAPPAGQAGLRYVGRVFELFIIVEKEDRLFIIDQHAAHERILYDRFLAGPVPRQELLVPIPFGAESPEDDRFLKTRQEDLAKLGIVILADGEDWTIEALPLNWRLSGPETVREILDLKNAGENLAERWAATLSCHSAVKDGTWLDGESALALAESALALPEPRCPHGRPVWFELSRRDLYRAVRRS